MEEKINLVATVKDYVADTRYRIRLHDLTIRTVSDVLLHISDEKSPSLSPRPSAEEVAAQLNAYESITLDLQTIYTIVCHWGTSDHILIVRKALSRLLDRNALQKGSGNWAIMRYYPAVLLTYSGGIGAIAAENYDALAAILKSAVQSAYNGDPNQEVALQVGHVVTELDRSNLFKVLPEHIQQYVPRSEYLFKLLGPVLNDLLHIGGDYEELFDRFEILFALVHADFSLQRNKHLWGPYGRFTWKHQSGLRSSSCYSTLLEEARLQQTEWKPLKAGLFGGSYGRFEEISTKYTEIIARLSWH